MQGSLPYINVAFSLVGFVLAIAGIALNWGVGWACLVGGGVLFAAGGLGSRSEAK